MASTTSNHSMIFKETDHDDIRTFVAERQQNPEDFAPEVLLLGLVGLLAQKLE